MEKIYEEWFRAMGQFRKLKYGDMFPDISRKDFFVMSAVLDKGTTGKITISELAARTCELPPAVSRTLKGLEEKGYVTRTVNQKDRRNTYVELTEEGERVTRKCRQVMSDFGHSVMAQVNEEDMKRMIAFLNEIYRIAEKEIETRKWQDGEEKGHE